MQKRTNQAQFGVDELYALGYTLSAAARKVKRSKTHVYFVLKGERQSPQLLRKLRALAPRPLILRERVGK